MAGNTFGKLFYLTTFGESHGDSVGGIIDGCPAGLEIDFDFIDSEIQRRKSQNTKISTSRIEKDKVEFISGIENGITLGSPICFIVKNTNIKKDNYNNLKNVFRPSHADFTYYQKYGVKAESGGGRASARETISRIIGGSIAKLFLKKHNIEIIAEIDKIGKWDYNTNQKEIEQEFKKISKEGDSLGGIIKCTIKHCPIGLGEPVFDKLNADLAKAMISIPAAKGFEIGDGFCGCEQYGSEQLDHWNSDFTTKTNHSGGIQGGISNGMDITFKVSFKPIATIYNTIPCIDKNGEIKNIDIEGRHDRCLIPRAVVVVESMAALTIADHLLRNFSRKINK